MAEAYPQQAIHLDGRTLEGGGQLVRNALVLAALTHQPVTITNIRGNRSGGGGLKAQHLACVRWLQHATNAHVEGAVRGSRTLLFRPGRLDNGVSPAMKKVSRPDGSGQMYEVRVDVETAGSTGLVLQAVLPYILFSKPPSELPIQLVLSGGTNVSGSPSYEYISQVLLPMLHAIGLPQMTSTILKRGWSQGGSSIGRFAIMIPSPKPSSLSAFNLPGPPSETSRRQPAHLTATFVAPAHCLEHFRTIMPPLLNRYFSLSPATISLICEDSQHDKRLYLILVAEIDTSSALQKPIFLASDRLYQSKLPASGGHMRATTEMAEYVAAKLEGEVRSGASADEHMRDQLVIYQALSLGRSEVFPGFAQSGEEEDDAEEGDAEEGVASARRPKTPKAARQGDRSSLLKREAKPKRHRQKPFRSVPSARYIDTSAQYDDADDPFEREGPLSSGPAGVRGEGGIATPRHGPNAEDDKVPRTLTPPSIHNQNLDCAPVLSNLTASTARLPLSDPPHPPNRNLADSNLTHGFQQAQQHRLRPASLHTLTAEWVCAHFLPNDGQGWAGIGDEVI